jgi:hypothetical protein
VGAAEDHLVAIERIGGHVCLLVTGVADPAS